MKKMLTLLFLLNILSSYTQTNPLQNKYSNAERVYIAYSMNEKILKCIESKFTDLRDKTLKSNLWLEKHFGKSKVNSGNFIKENSTVNLKDYENDSFRDCDSLDKKTSIFLLEHFEEIVSKTLIEENALGFNYQDNPILEFFDGYTQSFDTKGHQKAKNSDWSVKIPKSWVATETKNINIIQCFQNDYGTGDATIYLTVNDIPSDIEKDFNYEQAFKDRNEKLKKNQGSTTSTPISNKLMTIALLKGHLSIYDSELERLGIQMKIRQYNYQFNDEKYLYSFEGNINISENNSNIDIYEKLFFVCVNSIIVNKKEENIINLKGVKSQKLIEVKIAQKNYDFILDTGASVSLISKSIINNLLKEGIISNRNFLGKDYTKTADGTKHLVEFWNLPHIIIGDKKIYDINFAVMDNNIDPLLGMNIINKLNIWKIDLVNNKIYLNN